MNIERRRQIIEEVSRYTRTPRLQAHEFTTRQYAEANDLTPGVATGELNRALEEGLLIRRRVIHHGKRQWAYSAPAPDPAAEEEEEGAP